MTLLDYLVLVVYFLILAGLGLWSMRRVKVQEDYFMGGRGFGKLLQTFAAFGAGTGSSDPVNTGRTTFTSGMSGMWSVMYWLLVTPFYWITAVWYRRMRLTTLGDWFVERYESKKLGAAYAGFGILFYVIYGSMLFSAIGKVAAPLIGSGTFNLFGRALGIEYVLVPVIGVVVLVYGIAGGLRAAYWTDLLQGICIILLSLLLIPFGLRALVERFGDPATEGAMAGFRIMHERLPSDYFSVVGSSDSSEFPLHFIAAVVVINLVGIVVQPHFIATGGGSARNETTARVGLVVGNFLKRFCTVGWVITGLIALALFADSTALADDPDKTWGLASRELLGPGLRGLMLACLLAALMSSLDAYMIVGSALIVRNVYVPFVRPEATDAECLRVGRYTGIIIVGGAVIVSLSMMDVFRQLKLTWIIPVLFAAPFWIGMYWRRATTAAAWAAVVFSGLVFFLIPKLGPVVAPALRDNPALLAANDRVRVTTSRPVAPSDVAQREAALGIWQERHDKANRLDDAAKRRAALESLGERPKRLTVGDQLETTVVRGGTGIYWTGGVLAVDGEGNALPGVQLEPVGEPTVVSENTKQVVLAYPADVRLQGQGDLRLDFLLYDVFGVDLTTKSDTMLKTFEFPPKIITPFLVVILVSFVTRRNKRESLDRYYVKMKTPVDSDAQHDETEMALSYDDPARFDDRRLFPARFGLEFQKPTVADVVGFIACVAMCFVIVWLAVAIASIGS